MKTRCPACGNDSFGPYGPFELSCPDIPHFATLYSFECDTPDCTVQYYIPADSKEDAVEQWATRAK